MSMCCFCGRGLTFYEENNPYPACRDEDAVCCAECNATRVIPARIKLSQEAESRGIY